jgi:thioredoxin-like negative regulator of GroEL
MEGLREINDWRLDDELAAEKPALAIVLSSRFLPAHDEWVRLLAVLADHFSESTPFRLIDADENPSLTRKLKIRRLPCLVLFASGTEFTRWEGGFDAAQVTEQIEAMLRAKNGIE